MSQTKQEMNDEIFEIVKNGFVGLQIDTENENEITLSPLFQAINSLPEDKAELMYRQVKDNCELTPSAKENWNKEIVRNESEKSNPSLLIDMLKNHNIDYFKASIDEQIKTEFQKLELYC